MPVLRIIVLICGLMAALPAAADQTDGRLPGLFERLKLAPAAIDAAFIEQQIWDIWLTPLDGEVAALTKAGVEALQSGDLGAALKVFDSVVELAPDFAEGWNKRATIHYLLENLDQSLKDIARTLELEPRHFGALSGRGLVHAKQGDLERALESFEAALVVNPQMPGVKINAEAIRRILKQREI
jgi:tetratricopeptide (TPR) repeat protein